MAHHPNWLIFFRGVAPTTNQIKTLLSRGFSQVSYPIPIHVNVDESCRFQKSPHRGSSFIDHCQRTKTTVRTAWLNWSESDYVRLRTCQQMSRFFSHTQSTAFKKDGFVKESGMTKKYQKWPFQQGTCMKLMSETKSPKASISIGDSVRHRPMPCCSRQVARRAARWNWNELVEYQVWESWGGVPGSHPQRFPMVPPPFDVGPGSTAQHQASSTTRSWTFFRGFWAVEEVRKQLAEVPKFLNRSFLLCFAASNSSQSAGPSGPSGPWPKLFRSSHCVSDVSHAYQGSYTKLI